MCEQYRYDKQWFSGRRAWKNKSVREVIPVRLVHIGVQASLKYQKSLTKESNTQRLQNPYKKWGMLFSANLVRNCAW